MNFGGRTDYTTRITDLANKIPDNEPCFLIRGQDPFGPNVLRVWADLNDTNNGDPLLSKMARDQASLMQEWKPKKNLPDFVGQDTTADATATSQSQASAQAEEPTKES